MSNYRETVAECHEVIDGVRAYYGLDPFIREPKKRINYKALAFALAVFLASCTMTYVN